MNVPGTRQVWSLLESSKHAASQLEEEKWVSLSVYHPSPHTYTAIHPALTVCYTRYSYIPTEDFHMQYFHCATFFNIRH